MRFRETSRGEFLGYRRTEKGLHSGEGCEILSRQNTIKRKEAKRTSRSERTIFIKPPGRALECFRRCRL